MTNLTSPTRSSPQLGWMQNANFLRNSLGIRVTRTQLLATGQHIDLSTLAEQAGFQVHVFFRREVFDRLVENASPYHEETGDIFSAMIAIRHALMKAPLRNAPVLFQVGDLTLVAHLGNVDHDDPRRAITVCFAPQQDD